MRKTKYRKAKRTGVVPETETEDQTIEKVKNPFKAQGLRPAHVDYHPNNPSDRIYAWYMSGKDEELSENDQWYHHVFKTAHAAQIQGYTDSEICKILKKRFEIGERLAYKYIWAAQNLFGNVGESDKTALRYMLTQVLRSCIRQARKDNDTKAVIMAVKELKTIHGLDKSDAYIPDPSMLGGNKFIMNVIIGPGDAQNQGQSRVIELDAMDAGKEKLLGSIVDQMDQAPETEIIQMIEKEATDE